MHEEGFLHRLRKAGLPGRLVFDHSRLLVLAVFLLALGLRLTCLNQIRTNPFFDSPVIDSLFYDDNALQISRGGWMGDGVFGRAPLYSYFLAVVYRVFGRDYYITRLVQVLIGSLSCLLLFLITRKVFDYRTGVAAFLFAAVYGVLIFYDAELLRPNLFIFLILLSLLTMLTALEKRGCRWWAAAGLIFGLAALTRENILLFVPFVPLWIYLSVRGGGRIKKTVSAGLSFLSALIMVILPVTVRNYHLGGEMVLISSQGGLNFYIGNNPAADRTTFLQPGADWEETAALPARKAGLWKPSEQSGWYYRESFKFIIANPVRWLGMMLKKFVYFWSAHELTPNGDIDFYRQRSSLLRALIRTSGIAVPFGLIGPLALLGMVMGWKNRRNYLLLYFYVFTFMVSVVLFHVRARYRLPVVPVLIIFSAYALSRLFDMVRSQGRKGIFKPLLLLALFFLFVNADFYNIRDAGRLPLNYNLGTAHMNRGRYVEALAHFKAALEDDPENVNALNSIGIFYEKTGETDMALEAYRKAIARRPGYRVTHNNLGHLYAKKGLYEESVKELKKAVAIDPSYVQAYNNLGMVYLNEGLYEEAEKEFKTALKLKPGYSNAHYNLGLTMLALGRPVAAADEFLAAVELDPDDSEALQAYRHARRLAEMK